MAARAYRQGQVRLELVSIPAEVYSASRAGAKISFNQMRQPSGKRIGYEKAGPGIGPVDREQIIMGFDISRGEYVPLNETEIVAVRIANSRTLELVEFVASCEIDPLYFRAPYYVVPIDNLAQEAFIVFREALRKDGKVGIGQLSVQGSERLVTVRPCGKGLLLETLRHEHEVCRGQRFLPEINDIKPEREVLDPDTTLIEQPSAPIEASEYTDSCAEAQRRLINKNARSKSGKVMPEDVERPGATAGGNVVDLMTALKNRSAERRPLHPNRPSGYPPGARSAPEPMDLNDPVLVHWLDWDLLVRLGAAAVLGLLLGLDREIRGHAAGMRTHGLICFSAAAMTISTIALYNDLGGTRMDPLRVYEATGAFIGIIGAGLIVFSKGEVHNLTTAAHLWLAAVIGIACGAGQWPLVAIGSVISLLMLTLLRFVEPKDRERKAQRDDHAGGRQ